MHRALILLSLLAVATLTADPLPVTVGAEAAILINADSGAILYEKRAKERHYPASITKIATALYLLEQKGDELDKLVEISHEAVAAISTSAKKRANYKTPSHWIEFGSSHIGLKKAEIVSLKTLLYGLMLASGNDCANAIAEAVSGSIPQFTADLNARLAEIGCADTTFTNAHGLHHPNHMTTAYDMALIARVAMQNSTFREVAAALSYHKPESNKQPTVAFHQKNKLLRPGKYHYPKAIGIKTGYTSDAEATFVAAATDGERTLICVLLHCKETGQIYQEARKLFDAAFAQSMVERQVVTPGPQRYQRTVRGAARPIKTFANEGLSVRYYPAEEVELKGMLAWEPCALPIAEGQKVGEIRLYDAGGDLFRAVPLFAREGVGPTIFYRLQSVFGDLSWILPAAKVTAFIGTAILLVLILRRGRRTAP